MLTQLQLPSVNFGDRNWRQAEAWTVLAGAFEVNSLAQGALRQCTQRPWVDYPTFHFGDGHCLWKEILSQQRISH